MDRLWARIVPTWLHTELLAPGESTIRASLFLQPRMRHVLGELSPLAHPIATKEESDLRQIGGHLTPDMYLAVGEIVKCWQGTDLRKDAWEYDRSMILDCGTLLNIQELEGRPGMEPAPLMKDEDFVVGKWVANIGSLFLGPADRGRRVPSNVDLHRASLIDLRSSSATFGSLIDWPFTEPPPYDTMLVPFPCYFVQFSVLD